MKTCTKCKIEKSKDSFYNDKSTSDGLTYWCKICCKTKSKGNRNKEVAAQYYQNHKDEKAKYYRGRRQKDPRGFLIRNARKRAKDKDVPFSLKLEDLSLPRTCPLLGIDIFVNTGKVGENSPSIDELIPGLGYTKENSWIISYKANAIKNNATIEELELLTKNLRRIIDSKRSESSSNLEQICESVSEPGRKS